MSKREDRKTAARVVREQLERERRRKRTIWTSVIAVAALLVGGLIGWGVYAGQKSGQVNTPAHANAAGNAIVAGSGPVIVEEYLDFICPFCQSFHDRAAAGLKQMVDAGKITLVTHPVAYLDQKSTNNYSTRASAASACAADAGKFSEYVDVLFTNQPAEGGAGPTNDQLVELGKQAGLTDEFAQCVKDGRYITWAGKVSNDASQKGIVATPTVLVNGKKVEPDMAAIVAAVNEAAGAAASPTS